MWTKGPIVRNDFKLDNVGVHLPNSSTLGYSKYRAKRGDWVTFSDLGNPGQLLHGRVIGRVNTLPGANNPVRDHLMVATVSSGLDFLMVRWAAPADVLLCVEKLPDDLMQLITTDFSKLDAIQRLMARKTSDFSLGKDPA